MQRLKSKAQFQAVLAGPPVAKSPHFALHRTACEAEHAGQKPFPRVDVWMGVLIPKRWAKRAVTRNTIRRQIYEAARAHDTLLPQAAWVVRLRAEFSRKQFVSATSEPLKRAVREELNALLRRVSPPTLGAEARHVA